MTTAMTEPYRSASEQLVEAQAGFASESDASKLLVRIIPDALRAQDAAIGQARESRLW